MKHGTYNRVWKSHRACGAPGFKRTYFYKGAFPHFKRQLQNNYANRRLNYARTSGYIKAKRTRWGGIHSAIKTRGRNNKRRASTYLTPGIAKKFKSYQGKRKRSAADVGTAFKKMRLS